MPMRDTTVKIPFWKMHGAGNDFVLIDDRSLTFPLRDGPWRIRVCRRRTGVGAEGIVLIQPSAKASFRMRFFNPDGNEVDMCGNAARCVARLARELGAAPAAMSIETAAGLLKADGDGDEITLAMTTPRDWRLGESLSLPGQTVEYGFVNTGVPHVVVPVQDLDAWDVKANGAAIRYHERFQPAGTNANFFTVTGPRDLRVRTYERGVEDETLACGTGIVASALVAARLGRAEPPVRVTAASGDTLTVAFRLTQDGAADVTLRGPAVHVFQGTLSYP
jgi:diaminopimelate epimerase